jgi:predicted aspartyl protease
MPIADCGFQAFTPPGAASPVTGGQTLQNLGPTIPVEVGFSNELFATDPAAVQAALQAVVGAPVAATLIPALIDTGATESCIDEELAKSLNLPLIDRQPGSGVGGPDTFNFYLGHIRIAALNWVQYGRFMGARMSAGGQVHRVLLGRTLLSQMVLAYDGRTGSVTLAV